MAEFAEDVVRNEDLDKVTNQNTNQIKKIQQLEDELHRISGVLKESESENMSLKDEILSTNEKHQESKKKHENLYLKQISITKERHDLKVTTSQDELQAQEYKNKEAYDDLGLELKTSRQRVKDLKIDLKSSTDESVKFENLHKMSCLLAESEMNKAMEFERLLKLAKYSAIEMQAQMGSIQEELIVLYQNIAENQKLEETVKRTSEELCTVSRELDLSKSQVRDLERSLASKEAIIGEIKQELETRDLKYRMELSSEKELVHDAPLKRSFQELEAEKKVLFLENKVKELEQRLLSNDAKSKEKVVGGAS